MTKLKCWKKNKNSGRGMVTYTKGNKILDITGFHLRDKNKKTWEVEQKDGNISKDFKTKPQALSFANKYMKSHNTC